MSKHLQASRPAGSASARLLFAPVRALLCLLVLLAAAGLPAAATAAAPLTIDATTRAVDLWPAVAILPETDRELTLSDVMAQDARFTPADGPHANLGIRRQGVWLRLDIVIAPDTPGRWILDIDYPPLDRVDLSLMSGGRLVRQARLGDGLPFAERPLPGRAHAIELDLAPGTQYRLLMRVETSSSMILPMHLRLPARFHARESAIEAVQGLLAGIGACLLLYSLAHAVALRDRVFGYYAVSVAGITLFLFAYNGLAGEHLWPASPWLGSNAPPMLVLIALWGGLMFLEALLRVRELSRPVSWLMRAFAWLALGCALVFRLGFIDYRTAHLLGTVLGPMPMLLGLPLAWIRLRRGERTMAWLIAGWGLYGIGVVVMALLLRGAAPSNALTQHAFQFGAMAEMVLWVVLLGQRVETIRRAGERAHRERSALHSLALTDALTGLANRRALDEMLPGAIARSTAQRGVAVFMLDLDGFKPVNDRHGHDAGDTLLVAVGERLRQAVRRSDFIARVGGDEFVIVGEGFASDAVAQEVGRKLMGAFDLPFALGDGIECRIGMTAGYALAPHDGRDPAALLKRADEAMYAGKQRGKGRVARCATPSASPAAEATVDA